MFRALLCALAVAGLGGCQLIADFDRSKIVEDAGPSGGDGDGDGDAGPEPTDAAEPDDDAGPPDDDAGL